ncbi:hypothetical protein [Lysinibacillus sp. G4S2]|uniref:hypothetical protein n=1 Tax=Lysinibacillus sp. G4S2 TaxID=3055859 RepID=UPI0025A2937E|nr:hypothetical protein [Lysinibacillus sp. G4S2]MDM5250303.1 hypothetical protein [Lysinibacillus sp. G4S2]
MKIYDVLMWVTYTLVIVVITLVGIILLQGTDIRYDLLDTLTVVATLIGGLGGAFLGTWLSGKNASDQWRDQKEKENSEKLKFYELFVLNRLENIFIELSKPNKRIDFLEITVDDIVGIKKDNNIYVFERRKKAILDLFKEVDRLYNDALELGKNGIVDWETLNMLRDFKINSQRLKEIKLKTEIAPKKTVTEYEKREAVKFLENNPISSISQSYSNTISLYNMQEEIRELKNLIVNDIEKMENKLNKRREELNLDSYK